MDRPHVFRLIFLLALLPLPAYAHDVAAAPGAPFAWSFEPWVLLCLLLSAGIYLPGWLRLRRRTRQGGAAHGRAGLAFAGGWLALAAALVSPLDALGASLFSAHMLQHELMMIVAAPLLVLGRPFGYWLWALPARWRPAIGAGARHPFVAGTWLFLTWPLAAWLLHAAVLWLWHAPPLFEASLHSRGVHTLQHAAFLLSALLFWWAVLGDGVARPRRGAAMLYIFTTMAHTGALGALMTWSATVWYPSYLGTTQAYGYTPLEDQQLGGLIMWVPGGLAYLFAGLALAARWLARPPGPVRMPVAHDGQ
jgi:putative membrane protein